MGMRREKGRAKHPALHIPQTGMGWSDMKRDMMIFCSLYHLRALSLKEEKEKHTNNPLQGHHTPIWFIRLTVLALMWNARKGCHQPDLVQNHRHLPVHAASHCAFCPFLCQITCVIVPVSSWSVLCLSTELFNAGLMLSARWNANITSLIQCGKWQKNPSSLNTFKLCPLQCQALCSI